MLTKNGSMNKRAVMERLTLIKERHTRFQTRQRQEIEHEVQDHVEEDEYSGAESADVGGHFHAEEEE